MSNAMTPLTFASTDALLDELCSRFDHAIFAGMKIRPLKEGEQDTPDGQIYEKWRKVGNTRTCQGLAFGAMLRLNYAWEEHAQAATDDSPYQTDDNPTLQGGPDE